MTDPITPPTDARIAPTRAAELLDLPWQTYATAGELLQMSASSVERLVARGELPAVRLGRLVRIPTVAITAWTTALTEQVAS